MINQSNAQLIIQTFGLQAVDTNIFKGKIPNNEKDKSPIQRVSSLGTAIFSDLNFSPFLDGNTQNYMDPIDTALFTVRQNKNVVVTNINGRDGSIKEYVGMSDYNINIKGVICGRNGHYPKELVQDLITFCKYGQSLGIVSMYLNDIFGIQEVLITNFDLPQMEGGYSYQKFEIDCLSDKPVEILISEAQQ